MKMTVCAAAGALSLPTKGQRAPLTPFTADYLNITPDQHLSVTARPGIIGHRYRVYCIAVGTELTKLSTGIARVGHHIHLAPTLSLTLYYKSVWWSIPGGCSIHGRIHPKACLPGSRVTFKSVCTEPEIRIGR